MSKNLSVVLLLLCSCSLPATVDDTNKTVTCTDTRDGEVFSFNTSDVRNLRVGYFGVPHTFTVTDSEGRVRKLNSNMEAWLKCQ